MRFRGWNGAGGALQGVIAIANIGKAPCELSGYPTLRLIDLNGMALELESKVWDTHDKPEKVTLAIGTGMLDDPVAPLRPGQASFAFNWSNWCQSGQGPRLIEVSWPGGLSSVPVAAQTPRCDTPPVTSVISVGPFEAAQQ